MVLIPFRAVFALVRFDGPFNLPKHQLTQLAHRIAQGVDLRQRPEIPDGSKFAGIHDGDIQSAPGHDQIRCADGNGLLESDLVSENIITFTDTNGKLMALKPDVTLSIVKNGKIIHIKLINNKISILAR